MSKTLRKIIGDMNTHMSDMKKRQRHLEAVAKKIDVVRKKGASKKRKGRTR